MANQQERLVSLDFVGGVVVGEGCFSFTVVPNRGRGLLNPTFVVFMTDRDTIEAVYATLKHHGLPGYFENRPAKGSNREQYGIRVNGIKAVKKFCDGIVPHLTGEKLAACENMLAFCNRRYDMPRGAGFNWEDVEFVRRSREINGQRSHRKSPLDQLPRILRDYTPCPSA
jgi:hypothetical protein